MPNPQPGESEQEFVSRCIPIVLDDGTAKDDKQAAAICYSIYRGKSAKATSNPGDYLIVEDPEKPSTFHLQVKIDGKPDHNLMGSAWAALHGGYRGNKYEGPGKQEAIAKLRKMYEAEKRPVPVEKEGRRNATADLDRIQKAHDLLSDLGAMCKTDPDAMALLGAKQSRFAVFKDASGKYRWATLSSSAFEDKDQEIVSRKALENDVARADKDGDYGPLRWWHMDGVDLGMADFNAMQDRVLVESGTFFDERYGEAFKDADLEVSIGFFHPPDEPDANGVFNTIRRFERSLVPPGMASNLLTAFLVQEKTIMEEKKESALRKLLGPLADALLGKAKEAQKAAEEAGVAFKAEDPKPAEAASEVKTETPAPATTPAVVDEKAAPAAPAAEPPKTIGNMTAEQLAEFVAAVVKPEMDAVKAQLAAKKDADSTEKEVQAALAARLGQIEQAVKNVADGVAELQGEAPRVAQKGYRASQDPANVTAKKEGPIQDTFLNDFMPFVMGQKGQGQP